MKPVATYSLIDEITASPTQPLTAEQLEHHFSRIRLGFNNLRTKPNPTDEDWRLTVTAINLLETLIKMGVCADPSQLLADAQRAMSDAGIRHVELGQPIRLDGPGLRAVSYLLDDYEDLVRQIPARTMIRAYRKTNAEIERIYGLRKKRKHGKRA